MKNTKLLIFLIALTVVLSVNFAFAADDNATDLAMNADEDIKDNDLTVNEEDLLSVDEFQDQETYKQVSDDKYAVVDDDSKLSVETVQTINMEGITNRVNGGIWYKATFYDTTGKPLQNALVAFYLNDDNKWGYEIATDSNGVALLKAKISNGNHKISAVNYGTGEVMSDYIKVFNVITGGKEIKMYYEDGKSYKVRVFDDNGNPVKAGQKVTFFINNKKTVKKTDKNGYATLKITSTPGLYTISAIYKDFIVSNNLVVKNPFKVKMAKKNKNSKVKFTVKLLGKNKKNKLVKIKFNKKTYKAKTNKKGVANFKLKHPKKSGYYKLTVQYKKLKDDFTFSTFKI